MAKMICTKSQILWIASVLLSLVFLSRAQADTDDDVEPGGDPWETPLQELHRIASTCSMKISTFQDMAAAGQTHWQKCMDSISPAIPELESRKSSSSREEEATTIDPAIIQEIDKRIYEAICYNTTGYKSCWSAITELQNVCEPGAGDLSAKLYFALYDDICRDGGKITIEDRRKAAQQGRRCERDYFTEECKANKRMRNVKDLCLRFESNAACDISSIDPNCSKSVDKRLHGEIFERVRVTLNCTVTESSESIGVKTGGRAGISVILVIASVISFQLL